MGLLHAIGREYTYISSIGRSLYRLRHTKPESPRTISDIVDGVLYLESAPFVTGEILHIDGGQSAGH